MSISATCPGCGKTIAAPDTAAGHKAKCPQCGAVISLPDDRAAALAAALKVASPAKPDAESPAEAATPTPSHAIGGPSKHSGATTTVSRLLARTSPYGTLRLLAAIIFGVGIAASVLTFLGGLGALIVLATGGNPWAAVGVFAGALVLAAGFFLGAKTVSEVVRLWADVGDHARHLSQMLEESMGGRTGGDNAP